MRSPGRWPLKGRALLLASCCLAAAGCVLPALAGEEVDPRRGRALTLYDEGRYAEAKTLFEDLDREGKLDGPLLYRLAFSQRTTGATESGHTQERALALLEQELAAAFDLETVFYLVNSYQNLGRPGDLRRLAEQTTAAIESGEVPAPVTAIDAFRVGKLYADLGRDEEADRWFAKAVAGFTETLADNRVYLGWASRHLGDRAWAASNYAEAAAAYARLGDTATTAELDRLAVARARLGQYAEARDAWGRAERLDPAHGDRARYSRQIADMALQLAGLPTTDPAGRRIADLAAADLETLMREQVELARQARGEAASGPKLKRKREEKRRLALAEQVRRVRSVFVAAALEYTLDGQALQETAFRDGYAALIFRPSEWELPPPQ